MKTVKTEINSMTNMQIDHKTKTFKNEKKNQFLKSEKVAWNATILNGTSYFQRKCVIYVPSKQKKNYNNNAADGLRVHSSMILYVKS